MAREESIRMSVSGLMRDPVTESPIVVLRDDENRFSLPIWIGPLEAQSMSNELEGIRSARPMTHDLLRSVIAELGAQVDRVVVTELREYTYLAVVVLRTADRSISLDARPSDAISLALRCNCPIFVARKVLEAASRLSTANEPSPDPQQQDLSTVAPEEWVEILERMSPGDFKYKM